MHTLRITAEREPIQLAISANPVLPVLDDIAADERINGTIVISLTVDDLYENTRDTRAEQWVLEYSARQSRATRVAYDPAEQWLQGSVDSLLLSRSAGFHPLQWFRNRAIKNYVRTLPDRSQKIDYARVDRDAVYADRIRKYVPAGGAVFQSLQDFDERVGILNASLNRIIGRGGEVIVVRFPSSGRIWETDQIRYPKDVYWDRLAEIVDARTIHFADHPGLTGFDLPDGVHLDERETASFTATLAKLAM
jgi:hypothetical protein